jgi:hypothetical protein
VNNELERIWKGAIVACLNISLLHFLGETE